MTRAVSIIMPVYNTEKYLREALDSVLGQTMTDIEVLCVDDGSTDSSLEILHEYAAKDPRVTVYTQDHQFAGAARNLGIKHAAGKYLLFLDSDDIFPPDLAAKSFARAEETNADILIFGGENYYEDTGERSPQPQLCRPELCPGDVFSASDCPNAIFFITTPGPCNKIFRREFVVEEGLEFQSTRSCNDIAFVFTAIACAKRITTLNEPLFTYRQHSASLQHTLNRNPLAFYDAFTELHSRLIARGVYEPLRDCFAAVSAESCVYNLDKMKSIPDLVKVYNCVRDHAIPEFGLENLPEWTDQRSPDFKPAARVPEIRKLSAPAYIVLHERMLRKRFYASGTDEDRLVFDVLEENNKNHEKDIQGILNSPSYKIGRAATAPFRKIRDLLREK